MSDMGNVHSNDVEAELDGVMRTLIAAAARMGENIARMREEAARRAEAQSAQRAREIQVQFEQERAMARAQLQPTREPAWWDRARPEDVAHAYETSAAWKDTEPALAQAHAHMGDELRERYGIDVNDVRADPQRVAEVLRQRTAGMNVPERNDSTEQERRDADRLLNAADQHDRNAQVARDDAVATRLDADTERLPGVDQMNADQTREREQVAGEQDRAKGLSAWDSADRRDAHASKMAEEGVDPVAIQAHYGAEVSNAKHPRSAVGSTRGAAKARKVPTRSAGAHRERGERGR
ncbi:hypothetical protein [uncultured Microbacterium sp.]|uniref:hypothetical protein n=1 Tax=uncultured Microbacterium sp. TaxID=191216 RepID=UPI0025D5C5A7|nr:hypothetical protein [uncultured Microbacterium sp.]